MGMDYAERAYAPRYYLDRMDERWACRRLNAEQWEIRPSGRDGAPSIVTRHEFNAAFTRESIAEVVLGDCAPSSQIQRVGYDPATWDLVVEFKGGKAGPSVYHYRDVPHAVGFKMLRVPPAEEHFSLGKFFTQTVKLHPDRYPYRRVDEVLQDGDAPERPVTIIDQEPEVNP